MFCATAKERMPRRLIRVHSQIAPMAVLTISNGSRSTGRNTCR